MELTRAYVIHPSRKPIQTKRSSTSCLLEIIDLAEAINLSVIQAEVINLQKISPSTFLGQGTVDRLAGTIQARQIDLVILNTTLSPVQQRNLETTWKVKVIDRTGLILEIFGARAQTSEGSLQVDHAALSYQKSRLVRSWTHLERQRGGFGFMGGPGESQLELDKRMLDTQIKRIEKKLAAVKKTRGLHRKGRKKSNYPVVALVGYTNSGKSTLFNRLTAANVVAKDMLFATLDPAMRLVRLPSGRKIIVSDTVGFISDLPHELVEAFHATLEEVVNADLLLQVHDIASPEYLEQADDVEKVLGHIFATPHFPVPRLHVWNKKDLLSPPDQLVFSNKAARSKDKVLISASENDGLEKLFHHLEAILGKDEHQLNLTLSSGETEKISWLYHHGYVESLQENGQEVLEMKVRIPATLMEQFSRM